MTSDFGADIFDNDDKTPPSAPPKHPPRRQDEEQAGGRSERPRHGHRGERAPEPRRSHEPVIPPPEADDFGAAPTLEPDESNPDRSVFTEEVETPTRPLGEPVAEEGFEPREGGRRRRRRRRRRGGQGPGQPEFGGAEQPVGEAEEEVAEEATEPVETVEVDFQETEPIETPAPAAEPPPRREPRFEPRREPRAPYPGHAPRPHHAHPEGRHYEPRHGEPRHFDRDRDRDRDRGRGPREGGRPDWRQPAPAPAAPPAAPGMATTVGSQRVALLLDVDRLQREAQSLGGEVSFHRLLRNLMAQRAMIRAVAYVSGPSGRTASTLATQGFEVENLEESHSSLVAIAVDAMAVASRVDTIVLVPDHPSFAPLARTLRSQGVRVETAGFTPRPQHAGPANHHVLGKDTLFVP